VAVRDAEVLGAARRSVPVNADTDTPEEMRLRYRFSTCGTSACTATSCSEPGDRVDPRRMIAQASPS
jgi:hypothetical protein